MKIQLSDHFNYQRLLKFTIPSMIMMLFTSIYSMVDGFFVSNIVGKVPFAAVNFVFPLLMVLGALGFMFGTGGSALIAKTMGEGNRDKAKRIFSMIVYLSFFLGILIGGLSILFLPRIVAFLGAEGKLLEDAVLYGRVILIALPFNMLQFEFQSLFVAAEKPKLGMTVTIVSGVSNMILDALFMTVFRWGLRGAALATGISQVIGGGLGLLYFLCPNTSLLRLGKPGFDGRALLKICTNGSSELMSNIAMSVVSMLYNIQLLKYAGENGVAAYGVLMYVSFAFIALFIGYSVGVAPVVSFHFGAKNYRELKGLLKKSGVIIAFFSLAMFLLGELFAYPFSYLFVGYDQELMAMTLRGFRIFSFSFLFSGFAIFGSGFFTALNDGLTSALISFLRTLVFEVVSVLLLPLIWGLDGIWASVIAAELMAVLLTGMFLVFKRKRYGY